MVVQSVDILGVLSVTNVADLLSAEVVYEAVVMSLEEHAKHPQYTERLHSLLNTFISSAFVTGVSLPV